MIASEDFMHGSDDYDDFYEQDNGCYECGGEGFVSDCVEEWACVDPEYGCDYCTRRCPLCNPPKRNPDLDAVLSEAIATFPPALTKSPAPRLADTAPSDAVSPPATSIEASAAGQPGDHT